MLCWFADNLNDQPCVVAWRKQHNYLLGCMFYPLVYIIKEIEQPVFYPFQ